MKRGLKLGLFLAVVLISLWCVASVKATDYYVNATTGNDSLAGTSPATAWQTISEINGRGFSPGDNIYFERNETWREILIFPSSGSSGSQITLSAYGTGNKPIITAINDFPGWTTSGNWTEEVGVGANIWSISLAYDPGRAILDLTEYKEAEVEEDITSTYRWNYDSVSDKFYVYATENPSSFYSSMEIRKNSKTVDFSDRGYITMTGLDIQGAQVRIRKGAGHIIIDSCDIGKYAGSGIGISDSSYNEIKNNVIDSQIPDWQGDDYLDSVVPVGDGISVITAQDTADSSYNKIHNNIVKDWGHTGIVLQNIVSDTNTIHHNEVYLNEIYAENSPDMRGWTVSGDAVGRCTNNKLYQNNCHDMSVSCQVGGDNNEFYYNLIYNISPTAAEPGGGDGIRLAVEFGGDSAKICESNKIYNNIIYNMTDGHGILMVHWHEGTDYLENNLIRNNIIFHFPGTNKHGIYMTDYPTYIKNNTFENNLIWSSGVSALVDYYVVPKTIAEFNALNGDTGNVIKNNIGSDPLFVNASNNDFHLQYNSTCIDNGTDVNLTQDYEGNLVPQDGDGNGTAEYDIGAYEYQYSVGTYHVDASLGNDSWNGNVSGGDFLPNTCEDDGNSSDCTDGPWKTWNKVRGETYSAGDSILFKRGETFPVTNGEYWLLNDDGSADNYITIDAYGSGALPILDFEEELAGSGGWNNEGGNIWSKAIVGEVRRCRLDGVDSAYGDNATDIDGTTKLWYWGSDVLYIYSTQDPDSEYTNIKFGRTAYGIVIRGSYIKVQNLRFHGNVKYGAVGIFPSLASGSISHIEIRDCDFWYAGNQGIICVGEDDTVGSSYVTIDGNDIDTKLNLISQAVDNLNLAMPDGIQVSQIFTNSTISNNTITDFIHNLISVQGTADIQDNVIEYNTLTAPNSPYCRAWTVMGNTGKLTGNIVRYNLEYDTTVRNQLGGSGNKVYYNIIYGKRATESPSAANVTEGIYLTMYEGYDCNNNEVYNNVFYDIYNEGVGLSNDAGIQDNIIKNNIFMNCGQGGDKPNICLYVGSLVGAGNVISNNCFYDEDTADVVNYKGTVETVAEADATRTEFSSNVASDPLFVNASNNDYTLQASSPCIDNGTDVNLTQDYAGNTVPLGTNPDIGAYEYNDTVAPTISFSCSPTSVNVGGTIICSCSASDDVDSSPSVNYTVNPSTSSTGTYTTTCTALDDFGNSASSGISYTVSSTGGGGGTTTYKPTQEQLEESYEKILYINWKINFEFNNENHTINLDDIVNETAIITVSSQNQTFNLTINETKKLNLDDDNYYDLSIKLKDITGYRADLIVKLIHEEIPEEEKPAAEEEKSIREKINRFIEIMKSYWFWVVVVLVIIVITVIILIIRYKKMHYLGSNYKTTKSYT